MWRKLAKQPRELLHARSELKAAIRMRNAARSVVRDAMGRPMHAIVTRQLALCSAPAKIWASYATGADVASISMT